MGVMPFRGICELLIAAGCDDRKQQAHCSYSYITEQSTKKVFKARWYTSMISFLVNFNCYFLLPRGSLAKGAIKITFHKMQRARTKKAQVMFVMKVILRAHTVPCVVLCHDKGPSFKQTKKDYVNMWF